MKLKDRMNPKYTQLSCYVIVTCIIIYILSRVADNIDIIFGAIGSGLHWLHVILKPLIFGFAIAYILAPAADFFEHQLEKLKHYQKHPQKVRTAAVLSVSLIALAAIILFLSVLISTFTHQLTVANVDDVFAMITSYAKTLNSFYSEATKRLQDLNIQSDVIEKYVDDIGTAVASFFKGMGSNMMKSASNVGAALTSSLFAIIFAIYFLLDGKQLMKYWNRVLSAFTSKKGDVKFHQFVKDADLVFSGYIRGQLLDALIMAIMISISLTLLGVKFAVIIGILTGIGNLIPYVGPVVAYISTILVCFLNGDFKKLIIAVAVLFVIQTIDGNLINPKLLSTSIHIHPMLVIVSLIFGSAIGGFMGMLLAVPVGALIKIMFDRGVEEILVKRKMEEEVTGVTEEEIEEDEESTTGD